MRSTAILGLVLTATLAAQQPRPAQPAIPYPTPIFRMDGVTKSLNLTPSQLQRLDKLTEENHTRFGEAYQKLGNLPPAERAARVRDLEMSYNTDWNKTARDIFNANQFNRYQQLRYQYGGFGTLTEPEVQKRLNLTEQQLRNLNESMTWARQQQDEINRMGATNRERANRLYADYQKEFHTRFGRFLTPEQQRAWGEMTGEPFVFQPYFPPR